MKKVRLRKYLKNKHREAETLIADMINGRIPNNALIFPDANVLSEVFTKKRLELISLIESAKPRSIQMLADLSGRKKEAVHRDLKLLEGHEIVELSKTGRKVVPRIKKVAIYVPLKKTIKATENKRNMIFLESSERKVALVRDKKKSSR
ncbi:MAG: hypothetical protein ABIB71_02950 [Candidatus Woesearchaeota archaeon]